MVVGAAGPAEFPASCEVLDEGAPHYLEATSDVPLNFREIATDICARPNSDSVAFAL